MNLSKSVKSISFIERVFYQIPTILLSTLTIIAISRNLGPIGRGEISQILLIASLSSNILCTPIFLNIMHLKQDEEAKSYVISNLFLFEPKRLAIISALNLMLLGLHISNKEFLSLWSIVCIDLLILAYFISAQIRDLLLRLRVNKIYGMDFAVQVVISGIIFFLFLRSSLNVSSVVIVFLFAYISFAIFLLVIVRLMFKEFNFIALFRKEKSEFKLVNSGKPFSQLGIIFQLSMNKDLILGTIFLSKSDFGLMSALTSFWVIVRFLRPSAVIQKKLVTNKIIKEPFKNLFPISYLMHLGSSIYVQYLVIGFVGLLSYLMTPLFMGSGFKPAFVVVLTGTISEIVLMKCLFDMSIKTTKFSQFLFLFLMLVQLMYLLLNIYFGVRVTINSIWVSSFISYIFWSILNRLAFKP